MQQSKFNCYNSFSPFVANMNMFLLNNRFNIFQKKSSIYSGYNKEKYPESNSMSHLSTSSEGELNKIHKKDIDDNDNMEKDIIKGIKDITNIYINKSKNNSISLACLYFCDINLDEEKNHIYDKKIKDSIVNLFNSQ